jgi:VIT1/CCC1 family predicted Fe2+/Mn2+ transporter
MTVSDDALAVCLTLAVGLTGVTLTLTALFSEVSYAASAVDSVPMVGFVLALVASLFSRVGGEVLDAIRGPGAGLDEEVGP